MAWKQVGDFTCSDWELLSKTQWIWEMAAANSWGFTSESAISKTKPMIPLSTYRSFICCICPLFVDLCCLSSSLKTIESTFRSTQTYNFTLANTIKIYLSREGTQTGRVQDNLYSNWDESLVFTGEVVTRWFSNLNTAGCLHPQH